MLLLHHILLLQAFSKIELSTIACKCVCTVSYEIKFTKFLYWLSSFFRKLYFFLKSLKNGLCKDFFLFIFLIRTKSWSQIRFSSKKSIVLNQCCVTNECSVICKYTNYLHKIIKLFYIFSKTIYKFNLNNDRYCCCRD